VLGNKEYLQILCKGVDIESNYEWAKSHSWENTVNQCIESYKEITG